MQIEILALCKELRENPHSGATDILGIFDILYFDRFPARLDKLHVAIKFRRGNATSYTWSIVVMSADGPLEHTARDLRRPGIRSEVILDRFDLMELSGLEFKAAGLYSVVVEVGQTSSAIPLEVRALPPWATSGGVRMEETPGD